MECEIGKRRRNKVVTVGQSSRYIPEEIILNIVRRLPIKARGRFRCVSKQWCTLIPRRFKLLIIENHIEYYSEYYREYTSMTSIDQNMNICDVVVDVRYSDKLNFCHIYSQKEENSGHIMGSCNGLVLVEKHKDFFLWNPSTGYFGEKLHIHGDGVDRYTYDASGLCFDSNNGDYKAVIALRNTYLHESIMVGSFKTKTWTRVELPWERVYSIRAGPVLNDCLHWFVETMNDCGKIVYFDPKNDEFVDFPTPDLERREIKEEHTYVYGLCALDGYLCMFCNILNEKSQFVCKSEILIMKEYGVKESWEILFKIEPGVDDICELEPLFYTDDKEKVVIRTAHRQAFRAFDRNGKLCSDVKVVELDNYEALSTVVYEETLAKPTW